MKLFRGRNDALDLVNADLKNMSGQEIQDEARQADLKVTYTVIVLEPKTGEILSG